MHKTDIDIVMRPSPNDGFDELNLINELHGLYPDNVPGTDQIYGFDFDMTKIENVMNMVNKLVEDHF